MGRYRTRISIALTLLSIVVSFTALLTVAQNSNIKIVEVLIILSLGMGISALIFNLAQLYKEKKV